MFNLVVVLFFTFGVALFLIYFISKHDQKYLSLKNKAPLSQDQVEIEFKMFAKFCVDLCEYLKLEVKTFATPVPHEILIKAESINPITRVEYLVMGVFSASTATFDPTLLSAFSDQIISERISKGIVITPATIQTHLKNWPELAPMDFVDGAKYLELKNKMIL